MARLLDMIASSPARVYRIRSADILLVEYSGRKELAHIGTSHHV
jgi:hypothetical protein